MNKTKVVRYETNYLLSLSRYPEHFYALVVELKGRELLYDNPGISLRSFVLAGGNVLQEFLDVSGRMLDIVSECEGFCHDQSVIQEVHDAIMKQPYDVIEKISTVTQDTKTTNEMMKRLNVLNKSVDAAWDDLKRNSFLGQIDIFSPQGKDYKQAIFDLKSYASELVEALEHVNRKST